VEIAKNRIIKRGHQTDLEYVATTTSALWSDKTRDFDTPPTFEVDPVDFFKGDFVILQLRPFTVEYTCCDEMLLI
jgi:hypothetical protein